MSFRLVHKSTLNYLEWRNSPN